MKKYNYLIIALIGIIVVVLCALAIEKHLKKDNIPTTPIDITKETEFDYKMIKETNNLYNNQNYMISPLSIAYALSMVKDGAQGETKTQIETLLGEYNLDKIVNIKDKIGIANLIFIKNTYKNDINPEYISLLQTKHNSEILFDDFYTPKAINDWVSKKTFNMINNAVDNLSSDFVLGLANAIAIDVEWKIKFEPNNTREEEFTKIDKKTMNTAMMHSTNDFTYIESDNAKGIIKDYAIYDKETGNIVYEENDNTIALEYLAILPNKTIDEYLNIFNKNELSNLLLNKKTPNNKLDLKLSLPKYTYDFDYKKFKDSLMTLGMIDAFDSDKANFKSIADLDIYISKAIHKSHIELSENGTKAAAVTVFTFDKNAAYIEEKEVLNIEFNRPFIYLIKEKNSDNIWFFGTVYEPMKWEDNI